MELRIIPPKKFKDPKNLIAMTTDTYLDVKLRVRKRKADKKKDVQVNQPKQLTQKEKEKEIDDCGNCIIATLQLCVVIFVIAISMAIIVVTVSTSYSVAIYVSNSVSLKLDACHNEIMEFETKILNNVTQFSEIFRQFNPNCVCDLIDRQIAQDNHLTVNSILLFMNDAQQTKCDKSIIHAVSMKNTRILRLLLENDDKILFYPLSIHLTFDENDMTPEIASLLFNKLERVRSSTKIYEVHDPHGKLYARQVNWLRQKM